MSWRKSNCPPVISAVAAQLILSICITFPQEVYDGIFSEHNEWTASESMVRQSLHLLTNVFNQI